MPLSDEAMQRLRGMSTKGRSATSLADQLHEEAIANPLENVEYTGKLEADTFAEFDALLAAMESAADKPPPDWAHTSRSALWVCLVFLSRKDKEWLLVTLRIFELADKYVTIEDWEYALEQLAKHGPAAAEDKIWKPPVWTTNTDGEPITPEQLAYRQAAAKGRYLQTLQADSETWFCLCFRTPEQKAAWLAEHPPIAGTKYHDGYAVAESMGITIPTEEV